MLKTLPENGVVVAHSYNMAKMIKDRLRDLGRSDVTIFNYANLEHARGVDVTNRCVMFDNATLYAIARDLANAEDLVIERTEELNRLKKLLKSHGIAIPQPKKTKHVYSPGVI